MYLKVLFFIILIFPFQINATNCEIEGETVITKDTCIGEINFTSGDVLKSKFVDGVAEGYAEVIYSDKTIYNGTVSNNMSEGYAVQRNENGFVVGTFTNDNFYEGIYKYKNTTYVVKKNNENEINKDGLFLYNDGDYVYVGGINEDYQKHGDGIIYILRDFDDWKKGDYFIDQYENDELLIDYKSNLNECLFDEKGYVDTKNKCFADENVNEMRSVGIFENYELQLGFIFFSFDDGNYLKVGQFKDFELDGYGLEANPNTNFLHGGQYKKGEPNGYAINIHDDGTKFYGAIEKDFKANGIGYEISENGEIFFGIYRNNRPYGYGENHFKEGYYYKGNMNGDKFNGLFEILFDNNDFYYGQIENTQFNGFGLYRSANGDVKQGLWKNDNFEESLVFCKQVDNNYYYRKKNIGCANNQEISIQEYLQLETNFENYSSWTNAYYEDIERWVEQDLVLDKCVIEDGKLITNDKCWGTELEYGNFVYTGPLINGKMNGAGELTITSGELKGHRYVGNFVDDLYDGEGLYIYTNGDYYKGEFKNDKYHGYGTFYYLSGEENGDIFEGYYQEGYKHGQGKYTYADGNIVEGQYKNGDLDGIFYINGEEAIFKNDEIVFLNDLNQEEIRDSVIKDCEIFDNQINSSEECSVVNFEILDAEYTGTILNKKKHGLGSERTIKGEFIGNSYTGEYKNGLYHGEGKYFYSSGDYYEGNFRFGLFDGYGVFYYKSGDEDGDIYEGYWKNGKENGQGKYTMSNGVTLEDEWVDGDLDGIFYVNGDAARYEGDELVFLDDDEFENTDEIISEKNLDEKIIPASSGSGFFINERGDIVTNFHVVDYCNQVNMHYKGNIIKLTLQAQDRVNDLAILNSNTKPDDYFTISNEDANLLDEIYVAGFPFGKSLSSSVKVTKGVVSSLSGMGDNFGEIQIDAALQTGNSGGPIVDNYGNVIGVAVSKLDFDYAIENFGNIPENTNFGIKSSILNIFAKSNQIKLSTPSKEEISSRDIGKKIINATVYLDCMMTESRIEEVKSRKILFDN